MWRNLQRCSALRSQGSDSRPENRARRAVREAQTARSLASSAASNPRRTAPADELEAADIEATGEGNERAAARSDRLASGGRETSILHWASEWQCAERKVVKS